MLVVSIPLIVFIDSFGLYCNMSRSLIGFYLINGAFAAKERSRYVNVILLTLGLYSSNTYDVMHAIGPRIASLN